MWASRPVARAVAIGCRRGGGLIRRAHAGVHRAGALLGTRRNEWKRRLAGAAISSRGFHTNQQQPPAMTDKTDTQDLKALELEHLRAIEATLDEIARDIAEMKAEARQFLTAQELGRAHRS